MKNPIWKPIDFGGASDAEDGWLVQGTVPNSMVTSMMFMFVTNLNAAYPAFFQAIPYTGAEVAITGTNQPNDTVSNIITLTTQIYDLSGTTNEAFLLDVNGDAVSTRSSLSNNAITLDTKYNPNGLNNVDLTVQGFASAYGYTTNAPADTKLVFTSSTSIPLDFENLNYLLFQSAIADPDIGTNFIEFYLGQPETCGATITDPSTGAIVFAATNDFLISGVIELAWNFTESDGVTPYSNNTYVVTFTASDPEEFSFTNTIDSNDGVRNAAGCYITYETENPIYTQGELTDEDDTQWLDLTLEYLYEYLYDQDASITMYYSYQVGANRNYTDSQGLDSVHDLWASFMAPALSNSYTSFVDGNDYPTYSDLTIGGAHGNGYTIGGGPRGLFGIQYLSDTFTPPTLQSWLQNPVTGSDWRLRKAAIWACLSTQVPVYSARGPGPHGETNPPPSFPDACGIRLQQIQMRNFITKNTGWFIDGLLRQFLQGPGSVDSSAQVAEEADELWVCGPNAYPGGCNPTYSSYWVVKQMQGMYSDLQGGGYSSLDPWGYIFMPYTSIYDRQLVMYLNQQPPFVHNR